MGKDDNDSTSTLHVKRPFNEQLLEELGVKPGDIARLNDRLVSIAADLAKIEAVEGVSLGFSRSAHMAEDARLGYAELAQHCVELSAGKAAILRDVLPEDAIEQIEIHARTSAEVSQGRTINELFAKTGNPHMEPQIPAAIVENSLYNQLDNPERPIPADTIMAKKGRVRT